MVSFEAFKESLGVNAKDLSNEEIWRIYHLSDRLAGALFDTWKKGFKKNMPEVSNNPTQE